MLFINCITFIFVLCIVEHLFIECIILSLLFFKIVETTSRHATETVTSEGKYYITVVAFNRALEPSVPVCSDGVTVDTSTPSVKEVMLENVRIRGGLVTNSGKTNVWVLGNDRIRRQVDNVTAECW